MELIFTGFEIGLVLVLIIYIAAILRKKEIPWLRTGFIILTVPLLLLYHFPLKFYERNGVNYPTMDFISVIKVLGSSLLLAVLINSIAQIIISIYQDITQTDQQAPKHPRARHMLYVTSIAIPLIIIFVGSSKTIIDYHRAALNGLAVLFGLWFALKLFWAKN
jgi:hypothetical protein